MENDLSKIRKKMWGEKIATKKLNIEGMKRLIEFDIYDGYAVPTNEKGKKYEMTYPLMEAVKGCKEFEDKIIEFVGGDITAKELSPIHVLMTFSNLYEDGKELTSEMMQERAASMKK